MNKVEELLAKKKAEILKIQAPPEMEETLRGALKNRNKVRSIRFRGIIAVALLLMMTFAYSYDAIAFYGKKFLGYDQVISGSLKDLNELGQGQKIDKSHTFSDGSKIIIDGIFFDDNELLVLYTERAGRKLLKDLNQNADLELQGLVHTYHRRGGSGESTTDFKQIKWVKSFEPPKAFEKWLTFKVSKSVDGKWEESKISFTLDRNQAFFHSIKQDINETVTFAGNELRFNSIVVTPMSTVLTGKVKKYNLSFSADNEKSMSSIEFDLIADGKKIPSQGGGIFSDGENYEWQFDGITKVKKLEITNIRTIGRKMIDKVIPITENTKNVKIGNAEEEFVIRNVLSGEERTTILIERKENVEGILGLFISGQQVSEVSRKEISREDGLISEKVEFEGSGPLTEIAVKALEVSKPYHGTIEIPVK